MYNCKRKVNEQNILNFKIYSFGENDLVLTSYSSSYYYCYYYNFIADDFENFFHTFYY